MSINRFTDNFWGEKNNGFDVLYHNMKYGQMSSKEFSDFLRESCSVEETYAKLLAKLAKMAGNSNSHGSCAPFWRALKTLAEKLSTIHMQLVHSWQDLIKDVQRYMDEQHKKHKAMKDSESATLETVQCIQATTHAVHKAKETYHVRCLEYERLKREGATQKELERAEAKYKKANDEYRSLLDKYANVRNDFEKRMVESCQRFQETEEHHLQQMKDFIDTYAKAWENQHALIGQVHQEFIANSTQLTVQWLLDNLIKQKTTGTEIPGPINFEDADLSSLPPPVQQNSQDKEIPILERPSKTAGFLSKSRREKKKEKKKKKKDKEKSESNEAEEASPQVDEEGFSVRPEDVNDRTSWDSSTDSDSDSEVSKKFKVEIKPFSPNGSTPTGNVDDIRKSIEGLRLSPTSNRRAALSDPTMKRSVSVTDSMSSSNSNSGKPSQDLLGLDLFGGSSSASTPTGGNYGAFAPPPQRADVANVSTNTSAVTTPVTNTNDYFIGSPADTPPSVPSRHRAGTPTGAAIIPSIGPPPNRSSPRGNIGATSYTYKATARPAGRMSPAPNKMDRADSVSNLNSVTFNTTSMPIGSSRGPSPLTIGMSDNIPLAIAFSETINGYFKGTSDANCKVKLTGDMMVSFPAGIVKVLTDNPSPAMLSFRIKNTTNLEHILVNKQLVIQDTTLSTSDSMVYTFDMGMLTEHLRRQADTNKLASYFNIDILKYQVKVKPGMESTPLHLVSYWKCDQKQTDFRLDYGYNTKAIGIPTPLNNITVLVPVDGNVTHMQSKPTASWSSEHNRAIWKLNDISDMNEEGGHGCLRAKFDLADGPSTPSTVAVQFMCEGTTLSGIDFELVGLGYRVSLVKKRFVTGKYMAVPDPECRLENWESI